MTSRMLFTDPRVRSPTTVSRAKLPWVMQLSLVKGQTERRGGDFPRMLAGVAAMSEPGPDDLLTISVPRAKVELPLVYLSQLWPRSFHFEEPIYFEHDQFFDLFITAPTAMVVLIGMRPG